MFCESAWDVTNDDVRKWNRRASSCRAVGIDFDQEPPRAPQVVALISVPVLGICYSMQTMAQQLGGGVLPDNHREFGYAEVTSIA